LSILKNMADLNSKLGTLLFVLLLSGGVLAAENHPPVLTPIGTKEVLIGNPLSFQLSAIDPDHNTLIFSAEALPVNASLNSKTGQFSWSPAIDQVGVYQITIIVDDNGSPRLFDSETVPVKVIFRTLLSQKAWGFGVKDEQVIVETSNLPDLYPKVAKITVDGQPFTSFKKELSASENPVIRIELASPYDISKDRLSVQLDGKSVEIPSFSDVQPFGSQKNILGLSFEIAPKNLSSGTHVLTVSSGNALGSSTQAIALGVGGLRIIGTPLTFPSPFNPAAGRPVDIQYTLSQSADIDILIVGSSGEILKKISVLRDEEGGKSGSNRVSWDGRTDFGSLPANGIYLTTIMEREGRKVLGKTKLTVYK